MTTDITFKLAGTILGVNSVQDAYIQGEAALANQATMSRFFGIEKLSLKKRLEELYMISFERFLEYMNFVLEHDIEVRDKRTSRHKKPLNATLVYDLFQLENEVVPGVFRHRKEFWEFLKKILSPKTFLSFVAECDEYWSITLVDAYPIPEYPIPEYGRQLWERAHEDGRVVLEFIQEIPCLMQAYIYFAMGDDTFREAIISKEYLKEISKLDTDVAKNQAQQVDNGVQHLKFEAVKTLLKPRVKATKMLFDAGSTLSSTCMAGSESYFKAEHIYNQIDSQKQILEEVTTVHTPKELIAIFKSLHEQTAELINHLQGLSLEVPEMDVAWKNVASLIGDKAHQKNVTLMLESAAQMQQMA